LLGIDVSDIRVGRVHVRCVDVEDVADNETPSAYRFGTESHDVRVFSLGFYLTDYEDFDYNAFDSIDDALFYYDACSRSGIQHYSLIFCSILFTIIHFSNPKESQPDIKLGCLEHQLLSGYVGLRSLMKRWGL
jgi:hypothetical protein